ncbi:dTDP-4-dehydrorhamnose reductase [Parasphingopyxis sp. CP4]|uniref:dTDP-4-dehydrorhamnose reductase n=1 Tax=Parasphingopyxis sp. CP4 TaxID=2724527 RepID=UPI0015A06099|nr:dTDP-4-dehydrorhamnose reductase [Parasphingopyxis sp. CP4]QLC21345.1 dTDP-4-dehydrorhamnose reductase [Parasphingopyxis sp. CP4]
MKIILFGAAGLLGSAISRAASGDHEIIAFTHADLDICDSAAIDDAIRSNAPHAVINCAAYTAVDAAETDLEMAHSTNAEAPGKISEICAQSGCTFVHISTDYVFGGTAERPYPANASADPINAYGRTKRDGEVAALAHGNPLIVRSSWLYGAEHGNFLTRMLELMREQDELKVVDDQFGVPTHANSLANAILILIGETAQGIHHFTDSGKTSWFGFASAIETKARKMGLIGGCKITPIATRDYPTAAARPLYSVLDCSPTWAITGTPKAWETELDSALKIWETKQ